MGDYPECTNDAANAAEGTTGRLNYFTRRCEALKLEVRQLRAAALLKDDEIVYLRNQLGTLRRAKYGDCAHPWNEAPEMPPRSTRLHDSGYRLQS